jgi:hypothetical protein
MGCCQGATKLVESIVGRHLAPVAIIESRRRMCRSCDQAVPHPYKKNKFIMCRRCGCFLTHKTRLASEQCPMGLWDKCDPVKETD